MKQLFIVALAVSIVTAAPVGITVTDGSVEMTMQTAQAVDNPKSGYSCNGKRHPDFERYLRVHRARGDLNPGGCARTSQKGK